MSAPPEGSCTADGPLALDRQLCFLLYAASRQVTSLYGPLLKRLDITYPQYLVLLALWEVHPTTLSVGELGTRLCLDSGTLTPLLKRMEVAGLLQRQRDPADERRVMVGLSPKGLSLKEEARRVPEVLLCTAHDKGIDNLDILHREIGQFLKKLKSVSIGGQ